jgi:hemerythrin-like domain-containing protein
MKATEILMSEHTVVERVLVSLENAVQASAEGKTVRPEFFIDAASFISGFADGCHHRKEENVLFKTMRQYGVPLQGGPIGVMLDEHEQGRRYTRAMRSGAEKWRDGQEAGRQEALTAAGQYAALLHQHILKENNILFPMADQAIPLANQEQVAEDFERVEHEETGAGVHEKYLALAESLEAEAKGWK